LGLSNDPSLTIALVQNRRGAADKPAAPPRGLYPVYSHGCTNFTEDNASLSIPTALTEGYMPGPSPSTLPCRERKFSFLKNSHVPLTITNDDTLSFQLPTIPLPFPPRASCVKRGVSPKMWVCKPPKLPSTYKISSAIWLLLL